MDRLPSHTVVSVAAPHIAVDRLPSHTVVVAADIDSQILGAAGMSLDIVRSVDMERRYDEMLLPPLQQDGEDSVLS